MDKQEMREIAAGIMFEHLMKVFNITAMTGFAPALRTDEEVLMARAADRGGRGFLVQDFARRLARREFTSAELKLLVEGGAPVYVGKHKNTERCLMCRHHRVTGPRPN